MRWARRPIPHPETQVSRRASGGGLPVLPREVLCAFMQLAGQDYRCFYKKRPCYNDMVHDPCYPPHPLISMLVCERSAFRRSVRFL